MVRTRSSIRRKYGPAYVYRCSVCTFVRELMSVSPVTKFYSLTNSVGRAPKTKLLIPKETGWCPSSNSTLLLLFLGNTYANVDTSTSEYLAKLIRPSYNDTSVLEIVISKITPATKKSKFLTTSILVPL